MVEVSHRCTLGFLEKDGEVEQATKAISGSLLGRIRMVNSGKENSGLQGVCIGTLRESSNLEAGPDLSTGSELRFIDMLQGGHPRHTQISNDMETGLDNEQGPIMEDGLEHGGSGHLES